MIEEKELSKFITMQELTAGCGDLWRCLRCVALVLGGALGAWEVPSDSTTLKGEHSAEAVGSDGLTPVASTHYTSAFQGPTDTRECGGQGNKALHTPGFCGGGCRWPNPILQDRQRQTELA